MSVTIGNIETYFTPEEGLPEEVGTLPIRQKLPFCGFHDCEISPPRLQNGRVTFCVFLFSCTVRLLFEGAENFVREDDLARVRRSEALQFLDCTIRRRGEGYEYTLLTAGAGEAKFTFRTARAQLRGIRHAAAFIAGRLARYRAHLRALSAAEPDLLRLPAEEERFPDADFFFFPYFDEAAELGILRAADRPFYALWRLHSALQEGEIEADGEDDDKEHRCLAVGGYGRYFRECGYDLQPLLQTYAPRWAENFAAAREAYHAAAEGVGRRENEQRLSRITARHLAGRWHCRGAGEAAMRYADLLNMTSYAKTPQGREDEARTQAYEDEFVRALCRCAADELQKAQSKI